MTLVVPRWIDFRSMKKCKKEGVCKGPGRSKTPDRSCVPMSDFAAGHVSREKSKHPSACLNVVSLHRHPA